MSVRTQTRRANTEHCSKRLQLSGELSAGGTRSSAQTL